MTLGIGLIQMRVKCTKPHFLVSEPSNTAIKDAVERACEGLSTGMIGAAWRHLSARWHAHESSGGTGTTAD
jgi:hypothetical protein